MRPCMPGWYGPVDDVGAVGPGPERHPGPGEGFQHSGRVGEGRHPAIRPAGRSANRSARKAGRRTKHSGRLRHDARARRFGPSFGRHQPDTGYPAEWFGHPRQGQPGKGRPGERGDADRGGCGGRTRGNGRGGHARRQRHSARGRRYQGHARRPDQGARYQAPVGQHRRKRGWRRHWQDAGLRPGRVDPARAGRRHDA